MFENESLSFEEQTIIQAAERYVQQELANEASTMTGGIFIG